MLQMLLWLSSTYAICTNYTFQPGPQVIIFHGRSFCFYVLTIPSDEISQGEESGKKGRKCCRTMNLEISRQNILTSWKGQLWMKAGLVTIKSFQNILRIKIRAVSHLQFACRKNPAQWQFGANIQASFVAVRTCP